MTIAGSDVLAARVDTTSNAASFVLRKIVWVIALLAIALAAINGFFTIEIQTGAPQQAAAGAIACFQVITPYVLARALDELTRGRRS